jgi:probable F420-dependent oxidoreductase
MAVVAGCTSNVRIGVSVLALPAREPLLLAKQLATLDNLSSGRTIVGVGLGWLREEFDLVAPGAWERRAERTDDYLALFDQLWNHDGPVEFQGSVYSCAPVLFEPKPSQRPRPPIEVGGNSPAARGRAVRFGDAWHAMQLAPADIAPATADIRARELEAGREAGSVGVTVRCSLCAPDAGNDAAAWRVRGTGPDLASAITSYAEAGVDTMVFDLDPSLDERAAADAIDLLGEFSER